MKRVWWQDKVAYQIYPKSFFDTNGDGIGDLKGIISKLDYLKDLGADLVWLSPVYVSPLADEGYDIADYYNIDPRFGTMDDMDTLIAEAKKRGIGIIMDLVVNHCSDEHEWFRKACEDPEGRYGKYFYIQKLEKVSPEERAAHPSSVYTSDLRRLPCNWRSYFGGPVWEKLPGHEEYYYLHLFHKKQPDLNWENQEVREEIYKMMNWWLDKGLAGFRVDAIINIKKVLPFRDYPADRDDGLSSLDKMLHEQHGVGIFLGEMRDRVLKRRGAFSVGEVFNMKEGELEEFIGENGYFSSMFDFSETVWGAGAHGWYDSIDITPDDYRNCVFETQKKVGDKAFISNIIENHDEPRGVSRYIPGGDQSPVSKKMLATVYFFLRGLPWIYQGQEIGMENMKINSIDEVDDVSSIDAYNTALKAGKSKREALNAIEKYGRDNARTPFQWNASDNAGFTSGKPWIRVNPNFAEINLENEAGDPESVYNHYKKMISLRKDPQYREALVYGTFEPYLAARHNVMAYYRKSDDMTLLVIANYQKAPRQLPLPSVPKRILLDTYGENAEISGSFISLREYEAAVLEM